MALYQIDIEKTIGTEAWTNVYHAEAADAAAAKAVGDSIVTAERPFHYTVVLYTTMRVRLAGSGHVGASYAINLAGTRASTSNLLPLFNCVLVDFANGASRPCRKYLRGGLNTGEVGAGYTVGSTTVTIAQNYATAIVAISAMRDPQGRTLSSGAPHVLIAMHQLRRGSRRRPILPTP